MFLSWLCPIFLKQKSVEQTLNYQFCLSKTIQGFKRMYSFEISHYTKSPLSALFYPQTWNHDQITDWKNVLFNNFSCWFFNWMCIGTTHKYFIITSSKIPHLSYNHKNSMNIPYYHEVGCDLYCIQYIRTYERTHSQRFCM